MRGDGNSTSYRCRLPVAFFGIALLLLLGAVPGYAAMKVVTTTEDIASLVREVGGNHVVAASLTRGYQDPHFVQAKPSLMVTLHDADLLIYQGLDLEVGWLPLLIQGARNSKIRFGEPGLLDMSLAVDPIQIPTGPVDRSMGDVHPFGNPHYTLDPENIKPMVFLLADHLAKLDPEHESEFESNRDRFMERFQEKLKQWKRIMEPVKGARLVTYHRTWDYFLQRFGIESIGTVEVKPGVQPTPVHLAQLAEKMNSQKVTIILQASYYRLRFSELLAGKTGARILSLPPGVGGVPEARTTIDFFDFLVHQIYGALQP
ncbi:ABC-type metal ion ABC transporter, periplasmic component [Nitrospina gracilis 3/211]|uniref:ABC-type metal ion ABC transporter, periplasmic component n=1 Tax=Nitrospina gracilis (strain 3/211) TaxID=1266370 RepID=M1ZCY5_NITG3|nr:MULTISPECIES: metal ABC transporter substrate-binding protein [Nitrospina]MCF8724111.1 zinc/manganese transport system substrate-binding protein [Nitrospina sp. Nb-3]CCQ91253.1 ABC-type metal ion ABC transporter, periplasmic component [Nitrospina gracilis 3/211]